MSLEALLASRLMQGPLPAAEVMALALYHPEHGYYRRAAGPWGFEGKDYYTALDVGPLLGQALARRLEAAWERLGRPAVFTVLEPGAGRGWLGRDLLAAAEGLVAILVILVGRRRTKMAQASVRQYMDRVSGGMDSARSSNMLYAPLPMLVFDVTTGEILWCNDMFMQLTAQKEKIFETAVDAVELFDRPSIREFECNEAVAKLTPVD